MKAAIVAAAIGGVLAVVEGFLLIVLGGLAGLAENRESEATMTGGFVVVALGAIVIMAVFVARRRPFVLAAATVATAAAGFLIENALWIFPAGFLLAAAALAVEAKGTAFRQSQRQALVVSLRATSRPEYRPMGQKTARRNGKLINARPRRRKCLGAAHEDVPGRSLHPQPRVVDLAGRHWQDGAVRISVRRRVLRVRRRLLVPRHVQW